jgi:signal transduction histidine kinase
MVFEPFFTTKRTSGGRGVGLTLSRAMVERHRGSMAIESPILAAGGTRVRITLPMAKKENPNGL